MSRKFKTNWYNRPFSEYFREQIGGFRTQIADDKEIGIEIEVEGRGLPRDGLPGWAIHEDGSLRGESAEYVFNIPERRKDASARLQTLAARLAEVGARVNDSYRTSVHVHMNARPMLIKQIYSNIMLYIMCEDVLAEIAGKDRIGNLFCLRAKDAGFFLDQLRNAVVGDNIGLISGENLRYSAVNPQALFRHGSLEYRSFRGTTDIKLIQQWVDLLCALKDAAVRYPNPAEICKDFSTKGPYDWSTSVFSVDQVAAFPRGWENMLTEGVQLIQHAAHGHDWAETPVVKPKASKATTDFERYVQLDIEAAAQAPGWAQPAHADEFLQREMNRLRNIQPRPARQAREWVVAPPPEPDFNQVDEDL